MLNIKDLSRDGMPFARCALFGAGHRGVCLLRFFERAGVRVEHFIDNNPGKQDGTLEGKPVFPLSRHKRASPELAIVIASHAHEAIAAQLSAEGLANFFAIPGLSFYFMPDILERHRDKLDAVRAMLEDEESRAVFASIVEAYRTGDDSHFRIADYAQYVHPRVRPENGDTVIDGGAFDGDTAVHFNSLCADIRLVCLEPFPDTFRDLVANTAAMPACTPVNKAAWSSDCPLRFSTSGASATGCAVTQSGGVRVQAARIDTLADDLRLERVDLIKLDVEGAELEALAGARGVITRHRPKLQICVYHSIEDLWEIPLCIAERFPGYVFHLGHHTPNPHESVLYARPRR